MYETCFQLDRRPFVAMPRTDDFFPAESIEAARNSLLRLIGRDEGPGLVVGPVGIGKTLLCRLLAETFRASCRVAMVSSGRVCTRRALLQVILHQLGLAYQGMEEGELRLSLIDHVTSDDFCPQGVLLLIDEADSLPMALLDELRTMTNIVSGGRPRIRLVIFGSARLEEKFAHPRLESFSQRLAGRFYLEPFNREETFEYVVTHFQQCGGNSEEVFSKDALELIYRATNGVPRLINQLCDHALILAAINYRATIDDGLVNEAWADLQQLPSPVRSEYRGAVPGNVVEFGDLEEDTVTAASQAESRLELIARGMAEIRSEEETGEPATIPLHPPEFDETGRDELEPRIVHTHAAHNPFAEVFEQEELVVDRFAAASTFARRHVRQVTCDQSQHIAEKLDEALRQTREALQAEEVAPARSAWDTPAASDDRLSAAPAASIPPGVDASSVTHLQPEDTPLEVDTATFELGLSGAAVAVEEAAEEIAGASTEIAAGPTSDVILRSFVIDEIARADGVIRTIELPDVLIPNELTIVSLPSAEPVTKSVREDDVADVGCEQEAKLAEVPEEDPSAKEEETPVEEEGVSILQSIPMNRPDVDPRQGGRPNPASRNFNRLFSKLRKAN